MPTATATDTPLVRDVIALAMKLAPADREKVALALLTGENTPPNSDADWEYWKVEIKRRIEDVENGTVKPVTPEEMHANIRKALEAGRQP